MNDQPKSSPGFGRMLTLWGILFLGSFLLFVVLWGYFGLRDLRRLDHIGVPDIITLAFIWSFISATLGLGLWALVHWLNNWRNLRRFLVGVAVFATIIAVFYAEEDWRGKRDWEKTRTKLAAQGVAIDWDKLIPTPVPDDQNFFMASPKMHYSFIWARNDEETALFTNQPHYTWWYPGPTNRFPMYSIRSNGPITVATITVIPAGADSMALGPKDLLITASDTTTQARANKMLVDTLGIMADGAQGFRFSQYDLYHLDGPKFYVQASIPLSLPDLQQIVGNPGTNFGHFLVKPMADGTSYQVQLADLKDFTPAAEYLKWNNQFAPDFDEVREALKRPYVQLPGDFSNPPEIPIPNFVAMRLLAQTLAQRAQCYLMLGQPDQALRELTLMNDSLAICHGQPPAKPLTLVAAMIDVAITDVYVSTVAFGERHHLWQEPQLAALQSQLEKVDLPPMVFESLNEQPAFESKEMQTVPPPKWFLSDAPTNLWQKLTNPTFLLFNVLPRGWMYENLVYTVEMVHKPLAGFDLANGMVKPQTFKNATDEMGRAFGRWSPFHIMAAIAVPNFNKAFMATTHNQTMANEGQIACALERYHSDHASYPESLDALLPQYLTALPHDLIGGQPLKYHTTSDGSFVLYSIGWNETDDGGVAGASMADGDWVWSGK